MNIKKILGIALTSLVFCAGNLCAGTEVVMIKQTENAKIYLRDNIKFFNRHNENGKSLLTLALFLEEPDKKIAYTAIGFEHWPTQLNDLMLDLDKRTLVYNTVPDEDSDAILYKIYSQINLDELLGKLKEFPENDFAAVYQMLYLISERVATVSDKRKIIDFFMEHFGLAFPPKERAQAKAAFDAAYKTLEEKKSVLLGCFYQFSSEYARQIPALPHFGAQTNAIVDLLQHSAYKDPEISKMLKAKPAAPWVIAYDKIYRDSRIGQEQQLNERDFSIQDLEKIFTKEFPLVELIKIQKALVAGEFQPEFAPKMREIVDQNYEIAFPIAVEVARKDKNWDDLAYYAYRCLKRDVYGLENQFNSPTHSSYFDYLEFLLEGLAKSDPQAAGTLYEFIAALPTTSKQYLWLVRAERILDGVNYDKDSAQKAGKSLAEKGFYENPKLEERIRKTFQSKTLPTLEDRVNKGLQETEKILKKQEELRKAQNAAASE